MNHEVYEYVTMCGTDNLIVLLSQTKCTVIKDNSMYKIGDDYPHWKFRKIQQLWKRLEPHEYEMYTAEIEKYSQLPSG